MSHIANIYVKKLRTAPNGDPVTLTEKGVLWYLADSHNEEESAAWPSIPTIAADNNVSERRVREILSECVRKQIVWRDERRRPNGSVASNHWRFTEIDGAQTFESKVAEDARKLRGQEVAAQTNEKKRSRGCRDIFPQNDAETPCEMPQPDPAECRTPPCDISHPDPATSRTLPCEISHPVPATSRTLPCNISQPLNLHRNTSEPPVSSQGTCTESQKESQGGEACGKPKNKIFRIGESELATALQRAMSSGCEADKQHVRQLLKRAKTREVMA